MGKKAARQITLISIVWCISVALSSCAHNYVKPEEMTEMKSQMTELQKSVANLNIRLEELNNSVFILQESTKANRESVRDLKNKMKIPTVYITDPDTAGSRRSGYASLPPAPAGSADDGGHNNEPAAVGFVSASKNGESNDLAPIIEQFENGRYGLAAYDLGAFLAKNPSSSDAQKARFLLAECYFQLGDHSQAAREYATLLADGPGPFAARATLRSAQCFRIQGHIEKSRQMYNKVVKLYPGTEEAKIAAAEAAGL